MKPNIQNHTLNDPPSLTRIVRSLDEGPDYQPNWRWLFTQQYLADIYDDAKDGETSSKLAEILDPEADEIIRKTVQFYCSKGDDDGAIAYAIRAERNPGVAIKIKAMIVAGRSIDQIAEKMGTGPAKIEFFEKLFFDVRGNLDKRDWLETICGHRLLQVAFERGWAGLNEVISPRLPKGQRTLAPIVSVFMNRSLSHARNLEASNVPTSEKDAQLLLSILQAHSRPVPYLEDESEPTPLPDDPAFQKFANLNAGRRECVRALIENIMDGAARRVAEQGLITEDSNEPPVSEQTLQLPAPNDKIVESPPNSDIASTG